MAYLETNKSGFVYFVKKFSVFDKTYRIREKIGKHIPLILASEYLSANFERISKKEADVKVGLLGNVDISYKEGLVKTCIVNSVYINNFIFGKDLETKFFLEFAKDFIFNSNTIEGSKISSKEVIKIIETGNSNYPDKNEIREVYNSVLAMEYLKKDFRFDLRSIKRLYYILTKDLLMADGSPYPRGFKKVNNVVNNCETIKPENVEASLLNLLDWYKCNRRKLHPFILAFKFHLKYEAIHPFLDGNGRTGRLLMNKILADQGFFPVVIRETSVRRYFNAVKKGVDGGEKFYYDFMLKEMAKTYIKFRKIISSLF